MTGQQQERRKSPRQRSLLRGKLFFNNRLNVADCTIRDISDHGARLVYSEAVTTPDELELYIPQKEQTFNVRIAWRRGQEVGVFFQTPVIDRPMGGNEMAERLTRLEAEVAALKRTIKKLKTDLGAADPDAA